ncbi:MAG: class III signal peptide [Thermoproteus sp. AZ2]|uniref:Class III signal peptide n=1 Tax=Thermoproteus sp. AZ2 TaxID=1609232 RepID=A0ACC6UY89_9CREN
MRGLTSIELAIILAIVIVIAVAVGWYMYTTFIAATSGTPRLSVVGATYYSGTGSLYLTVENPGPVATAYISAVYLQGQSCGTPSPSAIPQASGVMVVTASCSAGLAAAGTSISGQVVLTSGTTYPFTASVQAS